MKWSEQAVLMLVLFTVHRQFVNVDVSTSVFRYSLVIFSTIPGTILVVDFMCNLNSRNECED